MALSSTDILVILSDSSRKNKKSTSVSYEEMFLFTFDVSVSLITNDQIAPLPFLQYLFEEKYYELSNGGGGLSMGP